MKESVIIQKLIQVGQMLERGQLEYSGAEADTIYLLEKYAALRQPPDSGSLQDRLFELANDFAVAKKGEVAVKLHSIHNGLQ